MNKVNQRKDHARIIRKPNNPHPDNREYTVRISLNNINKLIFVTDSRFVIFSVKMAFLHI
jgi:hypothetical protein